MQWASETRIIPTRMGTSIGARDEFISSEDHPHAYGDKQKIKSDVIRGLGSSPRVWGQEFAYLYWFGRCGIIPTRMGTRLRK